MSRTRPDMSAAALAAWDELNPYYAEGVSGPQLEALCVQVGRARDARAQIDEEGPIVADDKGRPVPHPALAIEMAAQAAVRAWSADLRRYYGH